VELGQSNPAITKWMNTLKGAESFLDDAKAGKLPARALTDGNQLSSVEHILQKTKEAVHREATRLHDLEPPKLETPYGAKKIALMTGPGEENEGFLGFARSDKRPGQVMREVTDLVDQYKEEEDAAAKALLRTIASKIVESFDNHGLSPAQIAREVSLQPIGRSVSLHACSTLLTAERAGSGLHRAVHVAKLYAVTPSDRPAIYVLSDYGRG